MNTLLKPVLYTQYSGVKEQDGKVMFLTEKRRLEQKGDGKSDAFVTFFIFQDFSAQNTYCFV